MFDATLGTTNLLLGILAAVAVFEALALTLLAVAGWRLYTRVMQTLADTQQLLGPLITRVDELAATVGSVAGDIKHVTSRAAANSARTDAAVGAALALASYGIGGAGSVGKALRLLGVARGVRAAYRSFRGSGEKTQPV